MKAILFLTAMIVFTTNLLAQEIHKGDNFSLTNSISGDQTYIARDYVNLDQGFYCNSTSSTKFLGRIDPFQIFPPTTGTTGGPNGGDNGIVALTDGQLVVLPNGSCSFNIPLAVPPGTAGMTPELGLIYNSNIPNGLVGIGWNIAGLSVISRVGQKEYIDGNTNNVSFSLLDRYELDGKRLILISGAYYGADGSEYRFENDDFTKIVAYGSSNYEPVKFKVWTKSGLIKEYGFVENAQLKLDDGKVVMWAMNRISDTYGNYIDYEYNQTSTTDFSFYPEFIKYTGNLSQTLRPYTTIKFEYMDREDPIFVCQAGKSSTISKILSKIVVLDENSNFIKRYMLYYDIFGDYAESRLSAINEHFVENSQNVDKSSEAVEAETGTQSTNFMRFSYTDSPSENLDYSLLTDNEEVSFYSGDKNFIYNYYSVDFNHDGKQDILAVINKDNLFGRPYARVFYSNGDGFDHIQDLTGTPSEEFRNPLLGDFNGDGFIDIVFTKSEVFNVPEGYKTTFFLNYWYYNNSSKKFIYSGTNTYDVIKDTYAKAKFYCSDQDGDGVSDIIMIQDDGKYWVRNTAFQVIDEDNSVPTIFSDPINPPVGVIFYPMDFNGDGYLDFLLYKGSNFYSTITYNGGFGQLNSLSLLSSIDPTTIISGDFNGDGKSDILGNKKHIFLGNGKNSFFDIGVSNTAGSYSNDYNFSIVDFNNDGRSDIFALETDPPGGNELQHAVVLSASTDGKSFKFAAYNPTTDLVKFVIPYFGDYNGDGKSDMLGICEDGMWNGRLYLSQGTKPNCLIQIKDQLNNINTIEYKPITDSEIYTSGASLLWRDMDFMMPLYVVSKTLANVGANPIINLYKYGGAIFNLDGRGFLGFTSLETTNTLNDHKNVTTLSYSNPFRLAEVVKNELFVNNSSGTQTLIESSTNSYSYIQNYPNCVFQYVNASNTQKFDFFFHAVVNCNQIEYQYDNFGNPTDILVLTDNCVDDIDATSTHTVNIYDNITNDEKWFLGRLRNSTITRSRTGQPDVIRLSSFEYSATTGLLFKEVVEPDNPLYKIEKTHSRDDFGNIVNTYTRHDGLETKWDKFEFESKGRFISKSIAGGTLLTTETNFNVWGKPTSIKDPNDNITLINYDSYMRPAETIHSNGSKEVSVYRWPTAEMKYKYPDVAYYTWSCVSGGNPVSVFYDKSGREVAKNSIGFNGNTIIQKTEYGNNGKISRKSDPYFEGTTNINWTNYEYDELERITKETLPGEKETTFFYNGRITVVTSLSSPHASSNIREVDPSGNLIKSTDNGTNSIKYEYYSSGLTSKIIAPGDKYEINIEYDLLGNKTLLNDPNIGPVTYVYNAYGELISEKNARQQETTYQYDILGRIKKRVSPEDSFEWFYDSKGKISYITGNNNFKKEYYYDVFGRIIKYAQQTDVASVDAFEFGYDYVNRPSITVYPSGFTIRNVYNTFGFLSAVVENESNKKIWETTTINAVGQVEATKLGNGLSTAKLYNNVTGFIEEIKCTNIQSMKFQWFDRALLQQRDDLINGTHETFEYDVLDRLHIISNSVTSTNTTIEYDILGNITSKSDVGTYTNGGSTNKPNCVESIILNSTSALLAD